MTPPLDFLRAARSSAIDSGKALSAARDVSQRRGDTETDAEAAIVQEILTGAVHGLTELIGRFGEVSGE